MVCQRLDPYRTEHMAALAVHDPAEEQFLLLDEGVGGLRVERDPVSIIQTERCPMHEVRCQVGGFDRTRQRQDEAHTLAVAKAARVLRRHAEAEAEHRDVGDGVVEALPRLVNFDANRIARFGPSSIRLAPIEPLPHARGQLGVEVMHVFEGDAADDFTAFDLDAPNIALNVELPRRSRLEKPEVEHRALLQLTHREAGEGKTCASRTRVEDTSSGALPRGPLELGSNRQSPGSRDSILRSLFCTHRGFRVGKRAVVSNGAGREAS